MADLAERLSALGCPPPDDHFGMGTNLMFIWNRSLLRRVVIKSVQDSYSIRVYPPDNNPARMSGNTDPKDIQTLKGLSLEEAVTILGHLGTHPDLYPA